MKKEYVLFMMLLIGFLVPMTMASKTLDFVTIESLVDGQPLFIGIELESRIDTRNQAVMAWEELATQKIRCSEYQTAFAVGQDIDRRLNEDILRVEILLFDRMVRYQVNSMKNDIHRYAITNYIRYL